MEGLGINEGRIIDPAVFKSENITLVEGENFQNGVAIKCIDANTEVFDTGYYPANAISGVFDIEFYWEIQGTLDPYTDVGVLEIWKDDELVRWGGDTTDGYIHLTYVGTNTVGTKLIMYFEPASMYRFVLRSGGDISTNAQLIFDYIKFNPRSIDTPFMSWVNPTDNPLTGTEIWLFDTGRIRVTGDGTAYTKGYIYPNYKFKRIYTAYVNVHSSATKVANVTDLDGATRFAYHIRDYQAGNWSSSYNLSWWCFGLVEAPVIRPLVVP